MSFQTILIIGGVLAVIFMILQFAKKTTIENKNIKKAGIKEQEKINEQKLLIDNVLKNYNEHANNFNNMQTEMSIAEKNKRDELMHNNDMEAFETFQNIITEYNNSVVEISEKLKAVQNILEQGGDLNNAFNLNNQIRINLEDAIEHVQRIELLAVEHYKDPGAEIDSNLFEFQNDSVSFFEGCNTKEEATKRFRSLSKAFHPDTGFGNKELFEKMKNEYERLDF